MRVTTDQLFDQILGDIVDGEPLTRRQFLGQSSVEEHLEEQIAELLAQ